MKKGFTLVELIGVIVILSLIITFVYPVIINIARDEKGKISNYERDMIINAAKLYIENNDVSIPNKISDPPACISISDLKESKFLKEVSEDVTTLYQGVDIKYESNGIVYELTASCS